MAAAPSTRPAAMPMSMPMPMLDIEALVQVTPPDRVSAYLGSCTHLVLEPPRMQKVPRVSPRMRYSAAEMQVLFCSLVPPWRRLG